MKVAKSMLSLFITASLFLITSSFYGDSYAKASKISAKKPAIVFDLGGVIFDTDRSAFFTQQLGRNALPYILLHCSKNRIKDRWYETLNRLATEQNYDTALITKAGTPLVLRDETGTPLPYYLVIWMQGLRSNSSLYHEIRDGIKAHPEWFGLFEQQLMLNMTRGVLKPTQLASTRKLIKSTVKLVKKLKKQGYPLYILSNWDAETFAIIQEQFIDIFSLFDGVMISGEVHIAKPSTDLYELFMTTYPHDRYCFIDDQQDNIDAAKKYGWHAIKTESRKPDIKDIRKQIVTFAHA